MSQQLIHVNFKMFLDKPKALRYTSAVQRKFMGRFGGYTRSTARRSIRKRKKSSRVGSPPSSHEGSLRRLIFFGYDRQRNSVVIGPLKFKSSKIPSVLEHGGHSFALRRNKKTNKLERTRIKIRPRPFMGPAFDVAKPKIPGFWKSAGNQVS